MLFEKTYGIDLGSSSVKVYSFFRNKTYIEKNMIASKGHTIIAMGNEACLRNPPQILRLLRQ